jgi:hypothetical protein
MTTQADRASGGSSIAVHNNYMCIHSQINLKTNLLALAVRLTLDLYLQTTNYSPRNL